MPCLSTLLAQENSSDTHYSLDFEYLSEDEHELKPPNTSEGEKQKNVAYHTRAKSYKRMEVAEVLGLMFSSEHFGEKGSVLSMAGNDEKRITDYLWRQMNKTDEKDFDKVSDLHLSAMCHKKRAPYVTFCDMRGVLIIFQAQRSGWGSPFQIACRTNVPRRWPSCRQA